MNEVSWTALGTAIGGVIAAIGYWVVKIMAKKGELRSTDHQEIGDEWKLLISLRDAEIARVNGKFAEQALEIEDLREQHHQCKLEQEQQFAWQEWATKWIKMAQQALLDAKILLPALNMNPPTLIRPLSHPDVEVKS